MIRKILVSAICTVAVLFCMSCAGTAGGGADDNVGYLVFSGSSRSLPAGKTYNDLSSIELYGSYRGGSEKKLASWSTGSTSGASSGWVLPDKDVLKGIINSKGNWDNSLTAIGGSAPGSILWSASEALSDGTRGVKINSSAAEQNEYKTIQHNICPVKIY